MHADLRRTRRDFGAHLQRYVAAISIQSKPLSKLQKLEDAFRSFSNLRVDSSVSDVTAAEDCETQRKNALETRKLECENLSRQFEQLGLDSSLVLALPSALMPTPGDRSEFQEKVLDQLEKEANRFIVLMRE